MAVDPRDYTGRQRARLQAQMKATEQMPGQLVPEFERKAVTAPPGPGPGGAGPGPGAPPRRGPRLPEYAGHELPGQVFEWWDPRYGTAVAVHPGDIGYSELRVATRASYPDVYRYAVRRYQERAQAERAELEARWAAEEAEREELARKELAAYREELRRLAAEQAEVDRVAAEEAEEAEAEQEIAELLAGKNKYLEMVTKAIEQRKAKIANPKPRGSRAIPQPDGTTKYVVPGGK